MANANGCLVARLPPHKLCETGLPGHKQAACEGVVGSCERLPAWGLFALLIVSLLGQTTFNVLFNQAPGE